MRIRTATSIITLGLCVALAAATEPLPEGNGLASRYPDDVGIASDSAVIFADDFESYTSGSGLASRWSNVFQMANIRISTETGNFFGVRDCSDCDFFAGCDPRPEDAREQCRAQPDAREIAHERATIVSRVFAQGRFS